MVRALAGVAPDSVFWLVMPICLDVYVWIPEPSPEVFRRFIDDYVGRVPGGVQREYLDAFERVYVKGSAIKDGDEQILAEQSADGTGSAFSLYLPARDYHRSIITITRGGQAVLGVSVPDPDDGDFSSRRDPDNEALEEARRLLQQLADEFSAPAGVVGVEMPPPQSSLEWRENGPTILRWPALQANVIMQSDDPAAGLSPGQQVKVTVLNHTPWGIVVRIGGWEQVGASIDTIALAKRSGPDVASQFPVGAEIDAVVLQVRRTEGYTPRVRLAPSAMMDPRLWRIVEDRS
jgi:hypothetical protein